MKEMEKAKKRKRNMKLFPIVKSLGWDYIFFYTTNFLFLTQVKGIAASDVVLIDSFYALFGILMQIPAVFIIEYLGRKKSIVFANFFNCLYMIVVMTSKNLFNLIIAELLSSLAFGIKESAGPALLNESIPNTKNKSEIFARISEKGVANWYIINAICTILAGIFYDINPYIPITLSLLTNIVVTIISTAFVEIKDEKKKVEIEEFNQLKELKESFRFILKSERLKSLILFSAIFVGFVSIVVNYEVSLLEELEMEAKYLCTIFAILGIVSGFITKKQENFHNTFKNKTLSVLIFILSVTLLGAGISGVVSKTYKFAIVFIIIFFLIRNCFTAIFYPLMERYLRNFANEEIDTKIFVARSFLQSIFSAVMGLFGSFLLDRLNTAYCMIILGTVSFVIAIMMSKYMKNRVGLKDYEYSKEEIKYDELVITK